MLDVMAAGAALTGLVTLASGGTVASAGPVPSARPPEVTTAAPTPVRLSLVAAVSVAAQPVAAVSVAAQPVAALTFVSAGAVAPPSAPRQRVIMIIRHGEKPSKGNSLTARGWSRAKGLATLFGGGAAQRGLSAPRAIFAAGATGGGSGLRTRETVSPLSSRLRVPVNTAYGKGQEAALVRRATAQARTGRC